MEKKSFIKVFSKHRETGLAFILLVLCVILSVTTKSFLTVDNFFNILKQATLVAIIAIGQTYVIIAGGIDLSVGYSMTLCSMILAYSLQAGIPVLASSVFGIGCSVLVGLVNGILITTLNIPPFIITLGMANIVKGIILVMSEGYICSLSEPLIINIGQGTVGPVPIMVIILIFLIVIFAFILSQTVFGNRVKAVGGNELAAELSGIKKIKFESMYIFFVDYFVVLQVSL